MFASYSHQWFAQCYVSASSRRTSSFRGQLHWFSVKRNVLKWVLVFFDWFSFVSSSVLLTRLFKAFGAFDHLLAVTFLVQLLKCQLFGPSVLVTVWLSFGRRLILNCCSFLFRCVGVVWFYFLNPPRLPS